MLNREVWKEQCRVNARSLESEIARLERDYAPHLIMEPRYDEFWEQAKRISALFKTPLFREDRERLWTAYSVACEEMKQVRTRERESQRADSREKRELVMSKIREAYFQTEAAATSAEFAQADALLGEALEWMKNGWEGFNSVTQLISPILGGSGILTREDREACWDAWKEAKELLRLRRDEFFAEMRAESAGRWRDWVEQKDELIETLQAEIDECEELERNARSQEFAETVRLRIEAKQNKIAALEARNGQLEAQIAEHENSLGSGVR